MFFITTFEEVVGRITPDPDARLIRLKSHLSGKASDAVRSCRSQCGEESYKKAMSILRERFGSPHIICNSIISSLKNGGNVRTPGELRTLADELANAEMSLKANSMFSEIDTQNNIVNISCRLHTSLRYKWRDHVMRRKRESSEYLRFSDFVNFLKEQADVVNDPIYGLDALSDTSAKSNNHRSVAGFSASTNSKDAVAGRSTYDRYIPIVCCNRIGEPNMVTSCIANKARVVRWNRHNYVILFTVQMKESHNKSDISGIVLVSPLLGQGKGLFQNVVRLKMSWIEPLPDNIGLMWNSWLCSLDEVNKLMISSCRMPDTIQDASY